MTYVELEFRHPRRVKRLEGERAHLHVGAAFIWVTLFDRKAKPRVESFRKMDIARVEARAEQDPLQSLQWAAEDTLAQLRQHRAEQHTEEYEKYLRDLPPRPWEPIPPKYWEFSRCDICQALFEHYVDIKAVLPREPFFLPDDLLKNS